MVFFETFTSLGLAQIFYPTVVNQVADIVVPLYTVLVLVAIISYARRVATAEPKKDRVYSLSKKKQTSEQKEITIHSFAGTWDKVDRPGFKEFLIFMGTNSYLAGF